MLSTTTLLNQGNKIRGNQGQKKKQEIPDTVMSTSSQSELTISLCAKTFWLCFLANKVKICGTKSKWNWCLYCTLVLLDANIQGKSLLFK